MRSPGDSYADLCDKAAMLLRAGTSVVIIVNPRTRALIAWDAGGKRTFSSGETFEHPAMPGFTVTVDEAFSALPPCAPRNNRPPTR